MNWRKLLAAIIHVVYMLVTILVIAFAAHYFDIVGVWESILFAMAAVVCIFISMHVVYWLMPASIRIYWNDDPPK